MTKRRKEVEEKLSTMRRDGRESVLVVADFDMTLTSFLMPDGSRGMSTHGMLERSGYFGEAFTTRAKDIFNRFYPIEVDPNLDWDSKFAAMSEWWETTHKLIVEQEVTKKDIAACVKAGHFRFREGVPELLAQLKEREVPILVFSAGIADVLEEIFKQRLGLEGLPIISNKMKFDEEGKLVGFENNTIHIMNKGAVALEGQNLELVKDKSNVILLGDSLGDLRMADGLPNKQQVLKIGFLNDKIEERKEEYLEKFDVVIVNDGPMTAVNELLAPIFA
ncbi:hypothetical protein GUITHDRAFT_79999 [Guillardia theta CCMP2712]|uniref:5'-nucleotidase n=1 Tax=Guillardia theta (strain CCMP2712) TaxID=905079 RepID=L1IHD4_GUITC|nr:hypothetical protein GUITHDRAFT_79999 [Guillardia theta CCMP2712]EKX35235.1 hypothetical protein GUITHDRAFT_79999 [Guillardia theta CCMP2712]|eukprot:XP_005822215.1 hypothetical protein GUITHDRAFT_79999 [Guillardia theta CCMP2712]